MTTPFLPAAADPGSQTPGGVFLFGHLVAQRDDAGFIGLLPNGVLLRPNAIVVGTGGVISAGPLQGLLFAADGLRLGYAVWSGGGAISAVQFTSQVLHQFNTAGGNFSVALPAAATVDGRMWFVKKITSDANTITLDPDGGELIDGAATLVLAAALVSARIVAVNGAWWTL